MGRTRTLDRRLEAIERGLKARAPTLSEESDPARLLLLRLCRLRGGITQRDPDAIVMVGVQLAQLRGLIAEFGVREGLREWLADPSPALESEITHQAPLWQAIGEQRRQPTGAFTNTSPTPQ